MLKASNTLDLKLSWAHFSKSDHSGGVLGVLSIGTGTGSNVDVADEASKIGVVVSSCSIFGAAVVFCISDLNFGLESSLENWLKICQ